MRFLAKAQSVILDNREYWPLTVRRVHYLLLNDPPLRHDKKPGSVYVNDKASYKALTNLLIRARLSGMCQWHPLRTAPGQYKMAAAFSTFEAFVAQETERFLIGYTRNLMRGQKIHVEIMLEKNALRTVIETVAREYCIPHHRPGFSSLSPRYDLARRFKQSGKARLVLLMLMTLTLMAMRSRHPLRGPFRDDFNIQNIHAVKGSR